MHAWSEGVADCGRYLESSFSADGHGFQVFDSPFLSSMRIPACFPILLTIMANLPDQRLLGFYDHSDLIPISVTDFGALF